MVGPHLLKGIWANGNHNKAMNVKGYNFLAKLPAIFTFIQLQKVCFFVTVSLLPRYPLWIPQRSRVEGSSYPDYKFAFSVGYSFLTIIVNEWSWRLRTPMQASKTRENKRKHRWWRGWWQWEVILYPEVPDTWYKISAVFKDSRGVYFGKSDCLVLPKMLSFYGKPAKTVMCLDQKKLWRSRVSTK